MFYDHFIFQIHSEDAVTEIHAQQSIVQPVTKTKKILRNFFASKWRALAGAAAGVFGQ